MMCLIPLVLWPVHIGNKLAFPLSIYIPIYVLERLMFDLFSIFISIFISSQHSALYVIEWISMEYGFQPNIHVMVSINCLTFSSIIVYLSSGKSMILLCCIFGFRGIRMFSGWGLRWTYCWVITMTIRKCCWEMLSTHGRQGNTHEHAEQ